MGIDIPFIASSPIIYETSSKPFCIAVFCNNVMKCYFAIVVAIYPTALLFCDVCQLQNSKTYKTS